MWRFALAGISLAACGGRPAVSSDDAIRYERGDGVPRDYTRAAQIDSQRCDGGDVVACRKLAVAIAQQRGDASGDPIALLTRACAGGDWVACMPQTGLDPDKAQAACDAGQPAACFAATTAHAFSQSSSVAATERGLRGRACSGGVLEACLDIVAQPGIAPDAIPADARAAVEGACQHGDADACAALGRPIAPQALCRAHDYKACTETGSAADLELACDHGSYDACNQIALAARDADPPDPHVVEKFARACKDAPHNLCDLNRPEDLVIGCAAYLPQRIPPDQRVALPAVPGPKGRPFVFLGRGAIPDDVLGAMAQRLAPAIAVYVQDHGEPQPPPPPATAVHIDAALAAAPISKLTSRADLRSVPFGQTNFVVVDGTGTPRAILSWGFGLIPATLARCVSGLLAEP